MVIDRPGGVLEFGDHGRALRVAPDGPGQMTGPLGERRLVEQAADARRDRGGLGGGLEPKTDPGGDDTSPVVGLIAAERNDQLEYPGGGGLDDGAVPAVADHGGALRRDFAVRGGGDDVDAVDPRYLGGVDLGPVVTSPRTGNVSSAATTRRSRSPWFMNVDDIPTRTSGSSPGGSSTGSTHTGSSSCGPT
nr:hypothetical protein [Pseudonocardia sp. H11422]